MSVHIDDDRDGHADDPLQPVGTDSLDEDTRFYEIVVPLEVGANRFVVSAQPEDRYSAVMAVQDITRLPPPDAPPAASDGAYKPGSVSVKVRRGTDGRATMDRLVADGVIEGLAPSFTYSDGRESTDLC